MQIARMSLIIQFKASIYSRLANSVSIKKNTSKHSQGMDACKTIVQTTTFRKFMPFKTPDRNETKEC